MRKRSQSVIQPLARARTRSFKFYVATLLHEQHCKYCMQILNSIRLHVRTCNSSGPQPQMPKLPMKLIILSPPPCRENYRASLIVAWPFFLARASETHKRHLHSFPLVIPFLHRRPTIPSFAQKSLTVPFCVCR
jgi:hypothetical protein